MFTLEDVLREARAVVAEKGEDYVYPESEKKPSSAVGGEPVCQYAHDGAPSCLVGHVIFRLDPEGFRYLAEDEQASGPAAANELVLYEYLPEGWWDDEAENAMSMAQQEQDTGATWGRALEAAERAVL